MAALVAALLRIIIDLLIFTLIHGSTDRLVKMAAIPSPSFQIQRKRSTTFTVRRWWRYYPVRLPSVHIFIKDPSVHIFIKDQLGKKKSATMSQSAECSAAFVPDGTQVSQNTARNELLLRACAFTYGWKRSEGGRRGEDSDVKKLFMDNILLEILLINI